MKLVRTAAVLTVALVIMRATNSFALSNPVLVNTSQSQNKRWETVFTNEVPLQWAWNADATHAQLAIVGMNSTFTTNFTPVTSSYLWQAFSGSTPSNEDMYDLILTFYKNSLVIGELTSQLAVVQGAFGNTEVISTFESTPWPKITKNVVIPYDLAWMATTASAAESQLIIAKDEDGMTQTYTLLDTAGYFGWKVVKSDWGYGTFNLALTFPGTEGEWNGTLVRVSEGMLIQVR